MKVTEVKLNLTHSFTEKGLSQVRVIFNILFKEYKTIISILKFFPKSVFYLTHESKKK